MSVSSATKANSESAPRKTGVRRVLHVLGGLRQGGVETWLLRVLETIDRDKFQIDFLVHSEEECPYDQAVKDLGSNIYSCPGTNKPLTYARNFHRILREHGPYDAIHSHVHFFSGYVLRIASQAGIPIRISHCHSDTSSSENKAHWPRRQYVRLMKYWTAKYATLGLAASGKAAGVLYGPNWKHDPRRRLVYCGVNMAMYQALPDRDQVRRSLGIPSDSLVVGHVGRFWKPKNHPFWIDIAAEIAKQRHDVHFLLVGDGPARAEIESKVKLLGLESRFTFTGVRPDVPDILAGAIDLFLMPSLWEGLPVAMLEAQAAGVPCVYSDVITEEAAVIAPILRSHSLDASARSWADCVLDMISKPPAVEAKQAYQMMEQSPFNILRGVEQLEEIYRDGCTD